MALGLLILLVLGLALFVTFRIVCGGLNNKDGRPGFRSLKGKHVVVTGGSSGIGLATAKRLTKEGANVTILARDPVRLAQARKEIEEVAISSSSSSSSTSASGSSSKVLAFSVDVSNYEALREFMEKAASEQRGDRRVDALICCAGVSRPGRFLDYHKYASDAADESAEEDPDEKKKTLPIEEFEAQMKINYLGSVYATRAALPIMMERLQRFDNNNSNSKGDGDIDDDDDKDRPQGRIVLVSSMAALVGIYGLSAYTATKYALRGFAECLQMELISLSTPQQQQKQQQRIFVSISFPPDVQTPMLENEAQFKPTETKVISEGSPVVTPEQIADDLVNSLLLSGSSYSFYINHGFDGWALGSLSGGMSMGSSGASPLMAFLEVMALPVLRLVGLAYSWHHRNVCKVHHRLDVITQKKKNENQNNSSNKKTS